MYSTIDLRERPRSVAVGFSHEVRDHLWGPSVLDSEMASLAPSCDIDRSPFEAPPAAPSPIPADIAVRACKAKLNVICVEIKVGLEEVAKTTHHCKTTQTSRHTVVPLRRDNRHLPGSHNQPNNFPLARNCCLLPELKNAVFCPHHQRCLKLSPTPLDVQKASSVLGAEGAGCQQCQV